MTLETSQPTTDETLDKSYFPPEMPLPGPHPDTQVFWDFCKQHELRIQRCTRCWTYRFRPAPVCYNCQSFDYEWVKSRGTGRVYSYIIVHHPPHPAVKDMVPFNAAVIELDDCGGVKLHSNVVDVAPEDMEVGLPVRLVWDDIDDDFSLPRFRRYELAPDAVAPGANPEG